VWIRTGPGLGAGGAVKICGVVCVAEKRVGRYQSDAQRSEARGQRQQDNRSTTNNGRGERQAVRHQNENQIGLFCGR
jgi:hypothetical protein